MPEEYALRKVDICVSVVEPETETETEPDPEPERNRNRNRNRNRKRNQKRNRNRNHNFFGGISPPHRRGEQKRFFLLKMTIVSLKNVWRKCSGSKILEVGLWLPPSPHPIPHAALWVLLYTKYCKLNFLKKRNFRESGRAKGF